METISPTPDITIVKSKAAKYIVSKLPAGESPYIQYASNNANEKITIPIIQYGMSLARINSHLP